MADPKHRNKSVRGTGLKPGDSGAAWRVGPAYDTSGTTERTENLWLSAKYRDKNNQGRAAGRAVSEKMTGYSRQGLRSDVGGEGGSIWTKAAIAAPAAIGAVVAGRRIWTNRSALGELLAGIPGRVAETPTFIQEFAAKYTRLPAELAGAIAQDQLTSLRALATSRLDAASVGRIWMSSRAAQDPRARVWNALRHHPDPVQSLIMEVEQFTSAGRPTPPPLQRTLKSFLSKARALATQPESILGRELIPVTPGYTPRISVIPLTQVHDETLRGLIQRAAGQVGGEAVVGVAERPGAMGGEYMVRLQGGLLGGRHVELRLPRTLTSSEAQRLGIPADLAKGIVATGGSQQTLRVPGQFMEFSGTQIRAMHTYPEFMMRRAMDDLLPQIISGKLRTQRQIWRAAHEFHTQMLGFAKQVDPGSRLQLEAYAHDVHAFTEGFRVPEERALQTFVAANPRFAPGPTPKRMFGDILAQRAPMLSTLNPATFHRFGTSYPVARKPWQFLRGYEPTSAAAAAMSSDPYHVSTSFAVSPWLKSRVGTHFAPRFRTAYIAETHKAAMASAGVGVGEWMLSTRVKEMARAQRVGYITMEAGLVSQRLLTEPAEQVAPGLFKFAKPRIPAETPTGDFFGLTVGEILGYRESGVPVRVEKGMQILGYETLLASPAPMAGEARAARSLVRLRVLEEAPLESHAKGFEPKAVDVDVGPGYLPRFLRERFGVSYAGEVNAAILADQLRKNRSVHNMQMFSELVYQARQIIESGRPISPSLRVRTGAGPGMIARSRGFLTSAGARTARMLYASPEAVLGKLERLAARRGDDAVVRAIYGMTTALNLAPEAVGGIFGAVPGVMKSQIASTYEQMVTEGLPGMVAEIAGPGHPAVLRETMRRMGMPFTEAEVTEIQKGVAFGVSSTYFGGPMSLTGAGRRGRLEPRAFELLSAPHYGPAGEMLKRELSERVLMSNPALVREQELLQAALTEIAGQKHAIDLSGIPTMRLSELDVNRLLKPSSPEFIGKTGALIEMEGTGDMGRLLVPPEEQLSAMRPGPGGYESPLMQQYRGFIETAVGYRRGKAGAQDFTSVADDMRKALFQAWSGSMMGKQGIVAGRLAGSQFLRAVSPGAMGETRYKGMEDLFSVGLPRRYGRRMFRELYKTYGASNEAIEAIRQFAAGEGEEGVARGMLGRVADKDALIAMGKMEARYLGGEAIPGLIARHPLFGPYNIVPVQMHMITATEPVLAIPERWAAVHRATAEGMAKVGEVELGMLAGMAGDKDADIIMTSLLTPRTAKDLEQHFGDASEWITRYRQFSIRDQLLRESARGGGLVTLQDLQRAAGMSPEAAGEFLAGLRHREQIVDMLKLGTAQRYVPRLSTHLSAARAAVLMSGIPAASKTNLLGLFQAFEQVPISGKHLPAARVEAGELPGMFQRIIASVRTGESAALRSVAEELFSEAPPEVQGLLREGIETEIQGLGRTTVPGIDLARAADDFQIAMSQARETAGGVSQERLVALLTRGHKGRMRPTADEMQALLFWRGGPYAGVKLPMQVGKLGAVSRAVGRATNELAGLSGQVLKHGGKPLAWGFGASLAIATLLSKPIGTLRPGDDRPPVSGMVRAREPTGAPTNLHPDSTITGEPSTPASIPPGRAPIGPRGRRANKVRILGKSYGSMDYEGLGESVPGKLGRRGRVRVQVDDRRTSLTAQKISSIIE